MKTILVPTDFSKNAANAMVFALDIAKRAQAEVIVLHVVLPNEGVDNNVYNAFWTEEYLVQRRKDVSHWARKFNKMPEYKEVSIGTACVVGFPASGICQTAEEKGADLIVVGSTGATGLRGVLLGSTAAGVMSKTALPVFAVPLKGVFLPKRNIVLATDFRFKIGQSHLDMLHEIAGLYEATIKVVHILNKPGESPDKAREASLSQKLGDLRHDFHYIHDRDVPQAVNNFVEAIEAGALVAVAHEHSLLHTLFFDSVTRSLAHRARVPLLALHDEA